MWKEYWTVAFDAGTPKAGDFEARAERVATGIELQGLIDTDVNFRKEGVASFGTYVSRINWGPLSGGDAVIRDCMDQSNFGTYDTSNNKAITIGNARVNLNVTFKRVGGGWKVFAIYNAKDEKC